VMCSTCIWFLWLWWGLCSGYAICWSCARECWRAYSQTMVHDSVCILDDVFLQF
jgi:hypothetical protein